MMGKSSNSESARESMWIFIFGVWGQTGGTVQRIIRNAITVGEFQAKWQWVSTLALPHPPPPGAGLIVGRLQSISEIDWTVSASLKNVLHSTSIVKQSKEGFHIRSTNIILNAFPCFSACHNWTYLTRCKTGCNKFTDESCDNLGARDKYNMINKCSE